MGGKARIGRTIADSMAPDVAGASAYIEPFVGAGGVAQHVTHPRRVLSDANQALITMWRALAAGWEPPDHLPPETWRVLRLLDNAEDPLTAFAGFGCSYGGKWFAGYARGYSCNYAAAARRSLVSRTAKLQGAEWRWRTYENAEVLPGAVVYCDPPYAGTTGFGAVGAFDHETFWAWVRKISQDAAAVYVSESTAPGWVPVAAELSVSTGLGSNKPRREYLYRVSG